jgi:amino acid transporter
MSKVLIEPPHQAKKISKRDAWVGTLIGIAIATIIFLIEGGKDVKIRLIILAIVSIIIVPLMIIAYNYPSKRYDESRLLRIREDSIELLDREKMNLLKRYSLNEIRKIGIGYESLFYFEIYIFLTIVTENKTEKFRIWYPFYFPTNLVKTLNKIGFYLFTKETKNGVDWYRKPLKGEKLPNNSDIKQWIKANFKQDNN